ncbi:MAG TPA: polysaccharide deacetylase family protein, partial [Chthoniobacteraceae bacterium]|nr:polysaccharide deacetylase family protein [Chthoniobacteraceae bacterium]
MKTNIRFLAVLLVVSMQGFALGGTRAPEQVSYDSVPITEPYLAITFDDGPSSMLTPQVLKILADRNAKATFFVTGENALSHPDIVKQELAAGHEI